MDNSAQEVKVRKSIFRGLWGFVVLALLVVIVGGIGVYLLTHQNQPAVIGENPQDFTLTTFSGESVDTVNLRGKVVLIHFWASWCSPCEDEARLLEEAWRFFQSQGRQDIIFLGIAYMDTEPASRDFLSTFGLTYPNGPDLQGKISNIYQVTNVPETYVLDQRGVLRVVKIGPFTAYEEVVALIDRATIVD